MPTYFSHTDRTLKKHLDGLNKVADQLLPQKTQKYWPEEDLEKKLSLLIAYHDIAKATPYFQHRIAQAITEENPQFHQQHEADIIHWLNHPVVKGVSYEEIKRLSHHTLFGAIISQQNFLGQTLSIDHLIFYEIIRRHHGDLSDFTPYEFTKVFDESVEEDFAKQFKTIDFEHYFNTVAKPDKNGNGERPDYNSLKKRYSRQRKIDQLLKSVKNEKNVSYFLKTQFLYSLLLSADKGDVMLTKKDKVLQRIPIPSKIIDQFKKSIQSGTSIDHSREDAYKTVQSNLEQKLDQNFFSITLPTGLGKTFAAYKAALRLKEENPNHRIIYCLPFTSIIDQNGQLLKDILLDTDYPINLVTLHHYLSSPQEKMKDDEQDLSYQEGEYLTEGWENEIIITTFVQLFESIFTNRNKALRKFHNLANSIIILDEIQNIPPQFIEVIEMVFSEMAEYFNTKFLFVTATQPLILEDKVIPLANKPSQTESYFFDGLDRIQLDQTLFKKGEICGDYLTADLKDTVEKNPNHSVLVIVNTKAFAQEVFDNLTSHIPHRCHFLSASLIPYHRQNVIHEIQNAFEPICVVSTQVVEAGVDIDFDIVYREFAPMDSINQAAGRCNRNGVKEKGVVKIFKRNKKPIIYDEIQLQVTNDVLNARSSIISEPEIFEINQEYFSEVKNKIQYNSETSAQLLDHIYGLEFECINEKFKLIEKKYKEYDFFIPVNESSENIWNEYLKCLDIEEPFKRKAKIQKIKPELLQFVVTIPYDKIELDDEEKEASLIKRDNWADIYDETKGVIINKGSNNEKNVTHIL